jgi:hypothetical protein
VSDFDAIGEFAIVNGVSGGPVMFSTEADAFPPMSSDFATNSEPLAYVSNRAVSLKNKGPRSGFTCRNAHKQMEATKRWARLHGHRRHGKRVKYRARVGDRCLRCWFIDLT